MSLRAQIFFSFLIVSIFPLVAFSAYLFRTNVQLAFELHGQNLYNSSVIQTDILEDHLNRMLVRANRFVNGRAVLSAFVSASEHENVLQNQHIADEILKFTDETLDSVQVFALVDADGEILYASGSNTDITSLKAELPYLKRNEKQYVTELSLGKKKNSIALVSPVFANKKDRGFFVVIYDNNFFLKAISGHQQIESSNAFIFCRAHSTVVESKFEVNGPLTDFAEKTAIGKEGSYDGILNGKKIIARYRAIGSTSWILVNEIPVKQVYSQVLSYGVLSLIVFIGILVVIVLLAKRQSVRILQPINFLLASVEKFFMSGAAQFSCCQVDKKTEVGYLAGKFAGMASDITVVQAKLKESNYLYDALLHAAYELHVIIDYVKNSIFTSSQELSAFFAESGEMNASEKMMSFFEHVGAFPKNCDQETVRAVVFGKLTAPVETELCCNMGVNREDCWYRIIAVPIIDEAGLVCKTVLHFKDVTASKREVLHLLHTSQRDPLCGLLNKKAFVALVQQFVTVKSASNAVFFIDLDNFKEVNDALGHAAGDEVLINTAKILTEQFRATDFLARYGGDEFVVFASGMTRSSIARKALALVSELSFERKTASGNMVKSSASIGIFLSDTVPDIETMIRYADEAMYRAKQKGKSGYYITEKEE